MTPESRTKLGHRLATTAVTAIITAAGILGAQAVQYGALLQRVSATEIAIGEVKRDNISLHAMDLSLIEKINGQAVDLAPVLARLKNIEDQQARILYKLDKMR